jgi:tRNA A37 N6-isopentenylltransferase MiaA
MEIAKVLDDGLSAEIAALHDRFETSSIQELGFGRVYARDLLSWGDE